MAQDNKLKNNIGTIIQYSKISGNFNDDLFNEQLLNFYKAKKRYNKARGANFNTFLHTFLKSRMLNYIRDKKYNMVDNQMDKNENEISLGKDYLEQIASNQDIENDYIKNELIKDINTIINKLDDRKRYIINERIYSDKTFRELGEELDISKQAVRQLYMKSLKKIKRELG